MVEKLNLFSTHYKAKYGKPVGKIALSNGLVCPNRKYGGCIYCAPQSFKPFYLKDDDCIASQIKQGREYIFSRKYRYYFAYFQQETTTAAPIKQLMADFETAIAGEGCVGLIVSTRPDYVENTLLQDLSELVKSKGKEFELLIELGLQSAHDSSLKFLNRNHTYDDFVKAAARIKKYPNVQLGVHLILGLPGEDYDKMAQTVQQVVASGVDAIKFHHLQVIRHTKLQEMFKTKPFKVYSAKQYLEILAGLVGYVPRNVVLHRLWSSSDPKILIAPHWGGLGAHQLHTMLDQFMVEKGVVQGSRLNGCRP